MNNLKIFNNEEFGQVRTVMIDGEPWFVGKDVAKALGYGEGKSLNNAVANHVDEEDKGVTEIMTPGGKQHFVMINESGVYSLIFGSKLEGAKRFKRWVTSEVLPALRKTGHYEMPDIKSIYDRKATSVGEVVNLVRIQQKAMERRGCGQQAISEMMAETFGQFGIPVPQCFLSAPGWKNESRQAEPDYDELLQILREETADMQTKPCSGGIAIPAREFNSFCIKNGTRSNGFKTWLYRNGYIAHGTRTDNAGVNYTVPVRIKGKSVRCVVLY